MNHLQADAIALSLIGHDVARIPDNMLPSPTPCDGWTVADLLRHMNEQHEEVIGTVLEPFGAYDQDPRNDFALIGARWLTAVQRAGDEIEVPKVGAAIQTSLVIEIHLVDMLVHRWDLAKSLGSECFVPTVLTDMALPIARAITSPGSPMIGPDGVYQPSRSECDAQTPIDNLAALLGRAPDLTAS